MQAAVGQLPLERILATFPGDDRSRVERQYLRFAGVGIQYALTVLVMTGIGIWLDNRAGTAPLLLLVFLTLGFVGATWSLIHQVMGGSSDKSGPGVGGCPPDRGGGSRQGDEP